MTSPRCRSASALATGRSKGVANDGQNDLRRVLAMMELTRDDEAALVKAFYAGWPLVVEQLSW